MQERQKRRLAILLVCALLLAGATALTLIGLRDAIVFYLTPSELMSGAERADRQVRVAGLVVEGSFSRIAPAGGVPPEGNQGHQAVSFDITDGRTRLSVRYTGLLPDLFREGQGVVAQGILQDGIFQANEILARHDENYMPREVADALRRSGEWRGEGTSQ